MRGTIKSVSPRMKDGGQRFWDGPNGTLYYFNVSIQVDGGRVVTGEAAGKTPMEYRFGEGDEVEFTQTEDTYGNIKLKIDRPRDGAAPARASSGSGPMPKYEGRNPGKSSGGWSPEKEASVMIQGLLKSIIEGGTKAEHWSAALAKALEVHDAALAMRVPKKEEAPEPKVKPREDAPPIAGYTGRDVPGKGIGDSDDDDAPF